MKIPTLKNLNNLVICFAPAKTAQRIGPVFHGCEVFRGMSFCGLLVGVWSQAGELDMGDYRAMPFVA
jgi:hypothetical protein